MSAVDTIFWWVGCVVCAVGAVAASGIVVLFLGSMAFWAYAKFLDRLSLWSVTRIFHEGGWIAIRASTRAKRAGRSIEDWRDFIERPPKEEKKE